MTLSQFNKLKAMPGYIPRLKAFAQIPEERDKECRHEHTPYRARFGMPCTGPHVCTMCGYVFDEAKINLDILRAL